MRMSVEMGIWFFQGGWSWGYWKLWKRMCQGIARGIGVR
jgi:hypothetical protein